MIVFIFIGCKSEPDFPVLNGPYLGQKLPGLSPEIFAPGIISREFDELNSVFSPDGNTFLFSMKIPADARHTIFQMNLIDNVWTGPEVLNFSGRFRDADPAFSPDGQKLFFISTRPPTTHDTIEGNWDIWITERGDKGWNEPKNLGFPINTDEYEIHPSVTGSGTLYFCSGKSGGFGGGDIYQSKFINGRFVEPKNLGDSINTEYGEGDIFIAPDESYIIFSSGRPGGFGRNDLYISFRKQDGSWTKSVNMGEEINSPYIEYCPNVSPDGKYLFFSSYKRLRGPSQSEQLSYDEMLKILKSPQNGLGNIYWVDAKIIDKYR